MTSQITFYLSQIIGTKIYDDSGDCIGKIKDLLVDSAYNTLLPTETGRPKVIALKTKINRKVHYLDFAHIEISRIERKLIFSCKKVVTVNEKTIETLMPLAKRVLDRQLVDINGRKLVRVNDIRMAIVPSGTFAIAVDIGTEGLLRRIGIWMPIKFVLKITHSTLPSHFVLWDDVETIDDSNYNIKLSRTSAKLQTLHPSDLADIIEEMGKATRTQVFALLDEEKAADVLEELEPYAQAHIIGSLSIEKAADVLEKMPADEVADLMDVLEEDKAELLLKEMDRESSEEVRELMEYDNHEVGSLMNTDFLTFKSHITIGETLSELRNQKPEPGMIYSLFITDDNDNFIATVSLGALVVTEHEKKLADIMNEDAVSVFDDDKIDSLAEIISKYNMLAIPVISRDMKMEGMVVIDDIVEDLLNKRKTK